MEALPGGGGSHVARLNFKTSRVGVYKCLSLIVGFAVTVAIWPREVVSRLLAIVLISSSAIPNHDVITGARGLGFAWSNLAKKTRDCSQSRSSLVAISFHALSLLFGPCRLSEFTLAGPLFLVRDATPSVYLKLFGSLYTRA